MWRAASAVILLCSACTPSVCGALTASAGFRSTDSLVERCGADLDTHGLRFDDGLLALTVGYTDSEQAAGTVLNSSRLAPKGTLYFWRDGLDVGVIRSAPDDVVGVGSVTSDTLGVSALPLEHAKLEVRSAAAPTWRLRWSIRFEGDAGVFTADGEDDVRFDPGNTADEPVARPGGSDAGPATDGGTECSREFGLPDAPQAASQASLSIASREPVADTLCQSGALAYLVTFSLPSAFDVTAAQVAFPGFALSSAQFSSDGVTATVLACSTTPRARLFVRLLSPGGAVDACANTSSLSSPACPFATSLATPTAGFAPAFTHTTSTALALCARGLRVSFGFQTDVRVNSFSVEQPYGRTQGPLNAISSPGWEFDACLSPPDVGVYAVQLLGAGLVAPPVCEVTP